MLESHFVEVVKVANVIHASVNEEMHVILQVQVD